MDDEVEIGQVDAARGDIGRHADPGAAVAHRLQRIGAFGLAELARQRHDRKAAIGEAAGQMADRLAGGAEDQRVLGVEIEQRIDDGVFAIRRRDQDRAVLDVVVLVALARRGDAQRVALKTLCQERDGLRHRCREQQRAAIGGRRRENEFEVFAKAEIKHLVGLVEDDGAQLGYVEGTAGDVVAQPAGRADDDMRALLERPAFLTHVHAADAGADARAGIPVEPFEFAANLHGKLAGRRDDQPARRARGVEALGAIKQRRRNGDAERDGLARTGLRGDQEVGAVGLRGKHCRLDGGQRVVATRRERPGQCRNHFD